MKQRCVKSDFEIELMKESVKITCEAHKYVMKNVTPGMGEWKHRELFQLYCGLKGTARTAYNCICGAGQNAATLHYIVDDAIVEDGKLILNDMGCLANGYCADVTTTFPVNGKFDAKQKEIYNIVLKANLESMALVKPGVHFKDVVMKKARDVVSQGLIDLGIIKCDLETSNEKVFWK